jgi:hypothetical protein
MLELPSVVWERAFKRHLDAISVPADLDAEGARKLVAEAERKAREEANETLGWTLVHAAAEVRQRAEEARERRERQEAERERIAAEARGAWKRRYGREVAARLQPFEVYALITFHGRTYALKAEEFEELELPVVGGHRPAIGQRAPGWRLPRVAPHLAAVADDVGELVSELQRRGAELAREADEEMKAEVAEEARQLREIAARRRRELVAVEPDGHDDEAT